MGNGTCIVQHGDSGAELKTNTAKEYGGEGLHFSSTDLLGAALGTCIGSSIEPVAERNSVNIDNIHISVKKELETKPKRVAHLHVLIRITEPVDEFIQKKIRRAADSCVVHKSLKVPISVELVVE